jgi:hypothetical protein
MDFEERRFRVAKTEGEIQEDLEEMTGQEVYALIGSRLGEQKAEAMQLTLEEKGSASIPYKSSFGQDSRFDIQLAA